MSVSILFFIKDEKYLSTHTKRKSLNSGYKVMDNFRISRRFEPPLFYTERIANKNIAIVFVL